MLAPQNPTANQNVVFFFPRGGLPLTSRDHLSQSGRAWFAADWLDLIAKISKTGLQDWIFGLSDWIFGLPAKVFWILNDIFEEFVDQKLCVFMVFIKFFFWLLFYIVFL